MIYLFDGSAYGFLTAFLTAFHDENALLTSKTAQLFIGETPVTVQTDETRAKKAADRLTALDKKAMHDLDILLRCKDADNEQVAFLYLRFLAKTGCPVRNRFAEPCVFQAVAYMKKVALEVHRFHGFIRFMQTESGALYAPFSPDNDICDLLVPHFRARFPKFPFVLHDVGRKKAAVYDGANTFIAPLEQASVVISGDEQCWRSLWKEYYRAVNIPARERLKQMRGYLPVRYWKYLTEKE
ncbi:MAG: TIGR03915 family putative DNA repair protein [Clostridia bacterium]|nr:TIGR03915 family putative DNA repair protein [Clostridia bacterium]